MDFKHFALKSEISKRFILVGGGGGIHVWMHVCAVPRGMDLKLFLSENGYYRF